jgi:hypothetical protein
MKLNLKSAVVFGALLALALAGRLAVLAQEGQGAGATNDIVQAAAAVVEAAAGSSVDQPAASTADTGEDATAGEEMVSTNDSASAGSSVAPNGPNGSSRRSGREARNQRFRRQRGGQSNGGSLGAGGSDDTNGPASLDYSAFSLVTTRNIFDPNRYRGRPRGNVARVESFALVGTMSYEKGTFAFFSGSSSDYQKALKCSDSIAGYKLTAINPNSVKLALATNEVELRVGMQMRREEDGPWLPSRNRELASSPTTSGASGASAVSVSAEASVPSGPQSDIIKRMMERREKE